MADVRQHETPRDVAGPAYVELLKERLAAETERAASLDGRGLASRREPVQMPDETGYGRGGA